MVIAKVIATKYPMSLPTRGGWIEIRPSLPQTVGAQSLPTRGGWIEMVGYAQILGRFLVPPHTGRVD